MSTNQSVSAGQDVHGPVTVVGGSAALTFLSGIGPSLTVDAAGLPQGIDAQIDLTLVHLSAALEAKGLGWENVVKILLALTDVSEAGTVTDRLRDASSPWLPALTVIEVDNLPTRGARLQLDVVAAS